MGPAEIHQFCQLDQTGTNLLKAAMQQMQLSARAYHRILKLARTIADLAGSEQIQTAHVAEAIQYRPEIAGVSFLIVNQLSSFYINIQEMLLTPHYIRGI
jgi:magnesium chelatase family protein